ncbi:hypothetical protein ACE193_15445 [Bernardetia sp. OM2101]|uniref:hypothetical protein n=1 Tax=Bernardetia sp. OM2101 TaxID=3344876 RepID=UPI0035CEDD76
MKNKKNKPRYFGSARVTQSEYSKIKDFLDKKKRKWSWIVRGLMLFNDEEWQIFYNQIEEKYEESEAN